MFIKYLDKSSLAETNKITNQGFTLIELVVVMAIIGILVLLAAPRFLGYTKDANVTAMEHDAKILADAAEIYHIEHEDWPVGGKIRAHDIPGDIDLFFLNGDALKISVNGINNNFNEYGIAIGGEFDGRVFHVIGVKDSDGKPNHGGNMF